MRLNRDNVPRLGQGCQHMYKSELLFETTGCILVVVHHLYTFMVLILLLPTLHRIYHWTYKHFCCGFGVFLLAVKKKYQLSTVGSSFVSDFSVLVTYLKSNSRVCFPNNLWFIVVLVWVFFMFGFGKRWSLRNWNKQTWLST